MVHLECDISYSKLIRYVAFLSHFRTKMVLVILLFQL